MARARAFRFTRETSERRNALAVRTVLAIAGALTSLVGLVLTVGGLLSPSDGSAFWVFTGIGLFVSGALIANRNRAGAWTFLAAFGATVSWSLHNIDDGSPLAVRLIGPALLLGILALLLPVLCNWRPRHAAMAFGAMMLMTIGLGVSSTANGPLARQTAALTQFLDMQAKGVLQ